MQAVQPLHLAAVRPEICIPRRARRIGDLLVEAKKLDQSSLARALAWQTRHKSLLGELLVTQQLINRSDLTKALSRQWSIGRADLIMVPPDAELVAKIDPHAAISAGCIPWRKVGETLIMAVSDPAQAAEMVALAPGRSSRIAFAVADRREIVSAITSMHRQTLVESAVVRCPDIYSSRFVATLRSRVVTMVAIGVLVTFAALTPQLFFAVVLSWVVLANAATTCLRLAAIAIKMFGKADKAQPDGATHLADYRPLPPVSILVPLYKESGTLTALIASLNELTYPKELLDVKLVLEEDDTETRSWLRGRPLPNWIEIISVPAHRLRTKPKAMNYALPFCRGEIVGVYDAEDRPEPEQIDKIVRHLTNAPSDVACVQGFLDFYNGKQNWLSRCFSIEYAIWFRLLLGGVQRLGIPIPLGGTTVFFRKAVLTKVGAWDAHNVTEDADLGMRLARFGYRCEMVQTTTLEEANCVTVGWIGQRSRWLKGYALTWITHMRNPATLFHDLGLRSFLGFQILFLGAMTSYLATPLFWLLWCGALGLEIFDWPVLPDEIWVAVFVSMLIGQAVMLSLSVLATANEERRHLLPWVLILPLYWSLGAVAAYKAIVEFVVTPFYWDKTRHGLSGQSQKKSA